MNAFTILLSLSFLLITFSAHSAPDPVLDINKKKLIAGVAYHILPVVRGRGGGLTLSVTNSTQKCPTIHVAQARSELDQGLGLSFLPVNPKKGVVRISTDHNIIFPQTAETACVNSTVGKLAYEESMMKYFVTVGGVRGDPGRSTIDNWFKIEKYESDYKLHFCPTVCNVCKVICRDFGIFIDGEGRRVLALSDDPFRVMFKKV